MPKALDTLSNAELLKTCVVRNGTVVTLESVWQNQSDLRVAIVAPYKIACGIATYTEALVANMTPLVKELKVFAEARDWSRAKPLSQLVSALSDYAPDVVYVQHEYGLFPVAAYWLSFISQLSAKFRTIVALHSVYDHADKLICESACPEVIVHTMAAAAKLHDKGYRGRIVVVPHGCEKPNAGKLWNLYRTPHTLVSFGFGFRYKAIENAIEAVALLKPKYPDVFYTCLFSESVAGKSEMDQYHADLLELVQERGLTDNVAIIRGFQSDNALDAYLRTNRIALFTYKDNGKHTVWAASGASLVAMSKSLPVITSSVPLFDQTKGVCPQADTPKEIAAEVEKMFDEKALLAQVGKQNTYLQNNSWAVSAQRYLDALKNEGVKDVGSINSRRSGSAA